MTATTYRPLTTATLLTCETCGGVVEASERSRACHTRWHDDVVDLPALEARIAAHTGA